MTKHNLEFQGCYLLLILLYYLLCFPGEDHPFGLPSLASNLEDLLAERVDRAARDREEDKATRLSPKVAVMKPILRFLQVKKSLK